MSVHFTHPFLVLSLAATACGSSPSSGITPDATAASEPPAACALVTSPNNGNAPANGPYGTQVDDRFDPPVLKDCNRQPFHVGDVLAQSELLLFNVGAGWCEPCIEETKTLDAEIFRRFCGRGLRVVQALFQDERSQPANSLFCQDWRTRFGLSFPVLLDDLFETNTYFEAAQTPLNLIIDSDGTIIFRDVGAPSEDFADQIDALLRARGL